MQMQHMREAPSMRQPQDCSFLYKGKGGGGLIASARRDSWDMSMIQMMDAVVPQEEIVDWQMPQPAGQQQQ